MRTLDPYERQNRRERIKRTVLIITLCSLAAAAVAGLMLYNLANAP
jgi:hypothetical protein